MEKRSSEPSDNLIVEQKSKRLKRKPEPENEATQKVTGLPERFQVRPDIVVNRKLTKEEISQATEIITKSVADYHGILITLQLSEAVRNTLTFFSQDFLEVPYIWSYKKDLIANLSRPDLWHILELEYDFRKFVEMRDQINSKISIQDSYVSEIMAKVKDSDGIYDLNVYIKSQEINISPTEYSHELCRKGMLPKGNYLEYILKGLLKVVDKFGVQIPSFAQSLNSKNTLYQPNNEELTPLEIVKQLYPESKSPDKLLKQSVELFAYEISVDPIFRKFIRENYIQHGILVTSPLEVVSANDECWPYCFWKVKIQKSFNISSDIAQILHYKKQNLINISFHLHNEEWVLETLKNNIVSDNTKPSYAQWNKYRTDAVIKAFNDILKPNIESWLIRKLEVCAERWIMEQCMLNLERKINVKPFRTSEMDENTIPCVFALSFGAKSCVCCVYINERNKKDQEWVWTELDIFEKQFFVVLDEFKPHIVVVGYYGTKTKLLFMHVKRIVRVHDENQSRTTTIIISDSKIASEDEYSRSSELSKHCTTLARMVQNPLMEHLRLENKIMAIKFHPLQYLLPNEKLKEALDRAFVNIVNEVGVDINDILRDEFNKPKQRTLNYISGFGPQKSIQLRRLIFGKYYDPHFEPTINSRSKLKDYLEENIFQNSIGFLRIHSNSMVEPLDNSRIHPDLYDLAKNNPSVDNSNEHLMQLINKENNNHFGDERQDYEIQTFDQAFEILTQDSLHPGLIISVVVKNFTATGVTAHLYTNSDFECRVSWDYIDNNEVNNIKIGKILKALVKSINEEYFSITLSCKSIDLEEGHHKSFHTENFDEFIDKEAKQDYQPLVEAKEVIQNFKEDIAEEEHEGHLDLNYEENKQPENVLQPNPKPPRTITHPCFEIVSAKEAEIVLSTQPIGSFVIRPTTTDLDKLSITWKIYDNIYRHLHIIEIGSEPGLEVGRRLFVEGEDKEYEALDELLVTYIQDTSYFVNELINHRKFRPAERQLNEYLETCLQKNPEYTAYGFCIDNTYPGAFIFGYKLESGTQMLKMQGMFRYYGFRVKDSRYYNLDQLMVGVKRKIYETHSQR